jgi:hypothetical protein
MHYQIKKLDVNRWIIWAKPINGSRDGYWTKHSTHKSRKIALQYASVLAGWAGKIEILN